jgi:hypothetical protein
MVLRSPQFFTPCLTTFRQKLTTRSTICDFSGKNSMKLDELKEAIYNACRLTSICSARATYHHVPWHFIVHALRQGLNLKGKCYTLQEKDYKLYPELRELVAQLEEIQGALNDYQSPV